MLFLQSLKDSKAFACMLPVASCFMILNSSKFSAVLCFSRCKIPVFIGTSQFWKRCCVSLLLHESCMGLTIEVQSCS